MEKRLLLAIVLSLAVVFLAQWFYSQFYPPPPPPRHKRPAPEMARSPIPSPTPEAERPSEPGAKARPVERAAKSVVEAAETVRVRSALLDLTLSAYGGGAVREALLPKYPELFPPWQEVSKAIEKKVFPGTFWLDEIRRQREKKARIAKLDREIASARKGGHKTRLAQLERERAIKAAVEVVACNPSLPQVSDTIYERGGGPDPRLVSMPMLMSFEGYPELTHSTYHIETESGGNEVQLDEAHPTELVRFVSEACSGLQVIREYSFSYDSYEIKQNVSLRNTGRETIRFPAGDITLSFNARVGFRADAGSRDQLYAAKFGDQAGKVTEKKDFSKKSKKGDESLRPLWAAIVSKYFVVAVLHNDGFEKAEAERTSGSTIRSTVKTGEVRVSPGQEHNFTFSTFIGPQEYERLRELNVGLERIAYSGKTGPIQLFMLRTMRAFYWAIPNWGVAIILLTLLIRVILYPLSLKSYRSMAKLQALQPQIKELQAKYKDNREKLNKATMELYRKNKVNPMGGCFPMLLQMPIFFSLFFLLRKAVELRGQPFLLWVTDLSAPDRVFYIPETNFAFCLLPLAVGASMFWQSRLQTSDPQQKFMAYLMPLFFTWIMWGFPSGLAIYWFTSTLLGIWQQKHIQRHIQRAKQSEK